MEKFGWKSGELHIGLIRLDFWRSDLEVDDLRSGEIRKINIFNILFSVKNC